MSDYKKIVVNTKNYSVEDMLQGTQPICDTKILEGNEWSFSQDELPATVYYETTSVEVPKVYTFASNEDHVEMATGRTLREEYMGVLKTMGKEFVSPDGSPVEVNNGIEARVISAEIKGQTVKNLFPTNNNIVTQQSMFSSIISQCQRLTPSTKYVFGVFVTKFTEQSKLSFKLNAANDVLSEYVEIPITKLGLNYIEKVVNSTSEKLGTVMIPSTEWGVEAKKFEFKNVYIADGVLYDNPQFGLNSTQAIIANNGQSYSYYEPTIVGKTRILKAPKDTQNWVEISNSEARDTVTYDYKLDSIAGDLGGTPSVTDYIDRARKVKVSSTKELTFDNTFNVTLHSVSGEFTRFRVAPKVVDYIKGGALICNSFKYVSVNPSVPTEETINNHSVDGYYDFWIKTSRASTVELFKTWLQTNLTTVRYQLTTPVEVSMTDEELNTFSAFKKVILLGSTPTKKDTLEIKDNGSAIYTQNTKDADDGSARIDLPAPIVTHIDKSLVPTILTQQTNTIEVGGAVKPSSFKVILPTTDGIKKEYVLTPINGWTGTAKANLLQTGDVGLVLDLTIPEQFNTLITNLPNELKPRAERTVLGYNGNTPVVVKIGTDGTVKLPVATTGVVKLDDTYKL